MVTAPQRELAEIIAADLRVMTLAILDSVHPDLEVRINARRVLKDRLALSVRDGHLQSKGLDTGDVSLLYDVCPRCKFNILERKETLCWECQDTTEPTNESADSEAQPCTP